MEKKKYTIQNFLEVKVSKDPHFSPDGMEVAYLSSLSGTSQIYLVPARGGTSVQLTDFPDSVSRMVFSPTEHVIVFAKSIGGNERDQLFLIDTRTREVRALTNNPGVKYSLGEFSPDGKYISYSSTERNHKDFDVYILNIESGEVRRVFELGDWCRPGKFSPLGTYVSVIRSYTNENIDLYICNLETGDTEHITPHVGDVSNWVVGWSMDESKIYILTDQDTEFIHLTAYSLHTKTLEQVLALQGDIDEVSFDYTGSRAVVVLNNNGYSRVSMYDTTDWSAVPLTIADGQVGSLGFAPDNTTLAFAWEDSRHASNICVVNIKTGEQVQLTNSPQGVPPEVLVDPELITYKSFDGLEVSAFVYKPKELREGARAPTIINIHGGPSAQHRPQLLLLTQYFVYAGYVVVAPNVRGSTGYGKTYATLDDVEKRLDSVKDIIALREYLQTIPEVDMEKLVLMGGSYGGFMVLACMAFYPELWAAGVETVGIANFVTFLENTADYRRANREAEYGSLATDRELLKSISPIHAADKITAPLFIIHGANDPRVPLSEAEQIATKMKELGRRAELLVYMDEGHGLSKLKNRLDAYPKVVEFLRNELSKI